MLFQTIETRSDSGVADDHTHRRLQAFLGDGVHRNAPPLGYQPVIALQSGQVAGLQAVQRRTSVATFHRGDSGPGITGWTLAQACVEARYWPGLRCAVSISARLLGTGILLSRIDASLAMAGLSPSLLEIEIINIDRNGLSSQSMAVLHAIRQRGIGIVLGNFGAGGAGPRLLSQMPLTGIKLDRRLVHDLPHDPKACARAGALLDAGRAAALVSIAGGIETLAQRDFLSRHGCDYAVGPLYSRPIAPERLATLLDYGVDTCSLKRSGSETRDERAVPH